MSQQAAFLDAIFDPDKALDKVMPLAVLSGAGARFSIYRNNVIFSLKENLRDGFPLLVALLGEAAFDALADSFVRVHRPKTPLMFAYGDELPAYLASFAPLEHLPYAVDVARLELSLRCTAQARDHIPLAGEDIQLDNVANQSLVLAPCLAMLASDWPIYDLWTYLSDVSDTIEPPAHMEQSQDVMVYRQIDYQAQIALLPPGGAAFLSALQSKETLATAVTQVDALTETALTEMLAQLIQAGLLTAII